MNISEKVARFFLEESLYHFSVDVTTGMVSDEVNSEEMNVLKVMGLKIPCSFDEIARQAQSTNIYLLSCSIHLEKGYITCDDLRKSYESGKHRVEISLYNPKSNHIYRYVYILLIDELTKHLMAYVVCTDITDVEESRLSNVFKLEKNYAEMVEIIDRADIGIWHIFLFDGEKPCMAVSDKMAELLCIDPHLMSGEEIYDAWYSRIKRSSIPSVDASVKQMIEEGRSENTYLWNHPDRGEVYVRCGGTPINIEGKGLILRGYHYEVTEYVTAELKQKQLLADALEEVQKQKKLLEEALDNYKEADYDRRTDFLTGLRNRQDMFELLHDPLSTKREMIKAMYMMDIDNFKMLNDHFGHTYGDECLIKVGEALRKYGEEHQINFYRYGGEEILGISFNEDGVKEIAEELVKLIFDLQIERDDLSLGYVSVSVGYTSDNSQIDKMIDKADAAMYKAKERGKNQAYGE